MTPIGFIEVREGGAKFKRISNPTDWAVLAGAASLALLAAKRFSTDAIGATRSGDSHARRSQPGQTLDSPRDHRAGAAVQADRVRLT